MSESNFEVVVIGAGISGLAFAKLYFDMHPECQLAVIEESCDVGGVWSSTRIYDEFWTQSGIRMSGFSDMPIEVPPGVPSYHGCIEARYVNESLENYVDKSIYNGDSLRSRIHFGHRVENLEKASSLWTINTRSSHNGQRTFISSKVVVATGLTSLPSMPINILGQEEYKGPVHHHKDFGEISRSTLNDPDCKKVVVLGAGKSATDMVYQCVKKRKDVSWIIRREGEGPALFFTAPGQGRYENSVEKASTRLHAALSPSSFMPSLWFARLIHGTSAGRRYLSGKLQAGDQSCRDTAAYQDRKGALPSFKHLEPTSSSFWRTGPLGLAQRDDFWDVLAQNVHIYRNDIRSMKARSIVLDDGSEIPADIILCGTGWKADYPFLSKEQAHLFGLPHSPGEDTPEHAKLWDSLLERADQRVLKAFPMLASPPPHKRYDVPTTTMRLYNCIAPLEDPSIVFLGRAQLSNSFRTAEAQAIWATAYFDGNINMPPLAQAQREVAYMNAFSRRRYPSRGAAGDYLFFELVWYTDKLLEEVGLKSHRKGWWQDWVEPCLAADFKDLRDEYRELYRIQA